MRPGRIAPDNRRRRRDQVIGRGGFNEAGANCPG